jgi:DNA-binding MarR family transcriptional regulator
LRQITKDKTEETDRMIEVVTEEDLLSLALFRRSLRAFLAFSENACADLDMTMQWYQALLTIKTFKSSAAISIGELAEELMIKNHSATELVNRLENAGLIIKTPDKDDKRKSLILITKIGNRKLNKLASIHLFRLRKEKNIFMNLFPE